jgi:hypothetical protein
VDKDSGLFFWYNTKDESSQWADTEGEGWSGYGSRRASTYADSSHFSNSLKNAALSLGDGENTHSDQAATATATDGADHAKMGGIAEEGGGGDGIAALALDTAAEAKSEGKEEESLPAAVTAKGIAEEGGEGDGDDAAAAPRSPRAPSKEDEKERNAEKEQKKDDHEEKGDVDKKEEGKEEAATSSAGSSKKQGAAVAVVEDATGTNESKTISAKQAGSTDSVSKPAEGDDSAPASHTTEGLEKDETSATSATSVASAKAVDVPSVSVTSAPAAETKEEISNKESTEEESTAAASALYGKVSKDEISSGVTASAKEADVAPSTAQE